MPIHFGEGSRMRIIYTTARFEVMSHRSIGQSTSHMLWRRLLRHPESHRSIGQLTLKRLFYVKTFSKNFAKIHRSIGQSIRLRATGPRRATPKSTVVWANLFARALMVPSRRQKTQGQVDFGVALRGPIARGRIDWPILRWILA